MEYEMRPYEFRSHDFYLAAICKAAGLELLRLERGADKFSTFVFSDPDNKVGTIISDHWSRKARIPTRDVIEAINELKTRLHSEV